MQNNFLQVRLSRLAYVIAGVAVLAGNATSAQAQLVYAPPLTYGTPVPVGSVYAYRPLTVYSAPVVVSPAPVVAYSSPVVVSQPYATYYSSPLVIDPGPAVVRERVNVGLFGARHYHYDARGYGFGHYHVHARDGWWGSHDRIRYNY